MPPKTKRARPVPRDERTTQLIAAAKDVFAKKGYHATTVDDITKAAGVAKGTFYLYFDEKRAIYYEVVRHFLQLVKDVGRSVAQDVADGAAFLARAQQAARELMRVFIENRDLARLTYRESMGLDRELEQMIQGFYRDIAEVEADNIKLGISLGMFRAVDPMLTAYAHIGMVERVLLTMLETPGVLPPPEQVVDQMLFIAFEGLRAR
ncbi:MAG: TetR/AcrR family transcriptional regulator [Deltaproteobacteria bacterium]|nr:TetR/AcrR family transcriptional regulator [Deltaproteobacteria bacterium]